MRSPLPSPVELVAMMIEFKAAERSPLVVALDGRSGSGKSTFATAVACLIPATIVPCDDFFAANISAHGWDIRSPAERARDALDWARLIREAIEPLLAGHSATWFPFDFAAGTRADGSYALSTDVVRRDPARVIILDGAYSARPELGRFVQFSILMEAPEAVRWHRLAAREEPGFLAAWHARWDGAEDHYFTHVVPPTAFDIVVDGS